MRVKKSLLEKIIFEIFLKILIYVLKGKSNIFLYVLDIHVHKNPLFSLPKKMKFSITNNFIIRITRY